MSRRETFERELDRSRSTLFMLSMARLFLFFAGIVVTVVLWGITDLAGLASLILFSLSFGWAIKRYSRLTWKSKLEEKLVEINRDELSALEGDHTSFDSGERYRDPAHDFSHDIDIFGPGSIYRYVNRTSTLLGPDILADCLRSPYEVSSGFKRRREAIGELAGMTEWRQQFQALGKINPVSKVDADRLRKWLAEEPRFSGRLFYRIIIYLMPAITFLLLILMISGTVHYSLFLLSVILNLFVLTLNLRLINTMHALVSRQYAFLATVHTQLEHVQEMQFKSPILEELRASLSAEGIPAVTMIRNLAEVIKAFDSRLNMVAGVMLNALFLWDYHCTFRLERWKQVARPHLSGWFDSLGKIDALSSLANYAFNNPSYCYPELSEGNVYLDATMLGHQLIEESTRVANDFRIERNGLIFMITGANMSGKSTFLRTVAVNLVLAMNGAPVCASRFQFTPARIFTSMRTTDSLSEHESYFLAELRRLKQLKENLEQKIETFFILDEILKGTNSRDKSEGSRMFIEKLLKFGATGIVATHDVSLASLEKKYPSGIRNLCFEITIEGADVLFDYTLRDGVTTRMNAALLMKQQGIID